MSKTRSYHHGNLREELLQAALGLLDEQGVEAISIRQVAKRVGVAHSAPANHFKNKQELLSALGSIISGHLVQLLSSELSDERTDRPPLVAESAIRELARIVLEYGLEHPNRYRLLWRVGADLNGELDDIYQLLITMLQAFADRKGVDVESQAIALWSLIHGYVVLRLDGHLRQGKDQVTKIDRQQAIIDVILDGIRL